MATIMDVAKKADVSISSVSYALNGKRPISKEKKEQIFQAITELGYQPNASARSLASKRTCNIALLFPMMKDRNLGFSEMRFVLSGAQYSIKNGYYMVMWFVPADSPHELLKLVRQRMVDGIILMEVRNNDAFVRLLCNEKAPFFLIGQDDAYKGNNYISIDFKKSMKTMIGWLKDQKHTKICFINHPESTLSAGYIPTVKCHQAFKDLCQKTDIQGFEIFCDTDPVSGCREVTSVLEKNPDITAFVSLNQGCLAGVIQAIGDSGRKIPQDISVIAFAASQPVSTNLLPQITAFEIDIDTIMERAVCELIAGLNNSPVERTERLVLCKLVERQSSAPPKNSTGQEGQDIAV
jgi:DNA-binding LacI/PurR family transcriptional regulator